MAKAKKRARRARGPEGGESTTEPTAPEFPKQMVRMTAGEGGQVLTDVQVADAAEAEATLTEAGYQPLVLAAAEPIPYPGWRYNATGDSIIVHSEEEDEALEGEWFESPEGVEAPMPVETELTIAGRTLGPLAAKLDLMADAVLGIPRAARRADGNFDPSTVPIARDASAEQTDARVKASRATADARSGRG